MQNADLTVQVGTNPYSLTVLDANGNAVVHDSTFGWTSGIMGIKPALFNGYVFLAPNLDPWREQLRVVAAKQTDGEIDVTLHGAEDNCITVTHTIRDGALRVEAHQENPQLTAWEIGFASPSDEGFLGLGERYDRVDHRGLSVYNWPEEGGLTTGELDPPGANNPYPNGGSMTYYPVPFFLSTAGYGFWLDTTYFTQFELATENPDAWRAWTTSPKLAFEIYVPHAADPRPWPLQVLDTFTATTGRPMIPPDWSFGPRRRINRDRLIAGVPEIQAMRDHGLAITAADDSLHFLPDGSDLGHEDELRAWVQSGIALGYKMIGYYNPYFSSDPASPMASVVAEGVANGYFLKQPDGTPGEVTLISGKTLTVYTMDPTFPDAVKWFTDQFKRALDLGYSGWMYDFRRVRATGLDRARWLDRPLAARRVFGALRQGRARCARGVATGRLVLLLALGLHRRAAVRADDVVGRPRRVVRSRRRLAGAGSRGAHALGVGCGARRLRYRWLQVPAQHRRYREWRAARAMDRGRSDVIGHAR